MDSYNPNFRIALSIKGARRDSAGFGSIVNVGALAGFEDSNDIMDKPPLTSADEENPVIILKNTEEYVSLRLVDGLVKPMDGQRGGQLSIGMTIPTNARIKDGKSPYTLLMEIYHKFKNEYMMPSDDNYYRFTDKEVRREVFEEIIKKYPIEETVSRPSPMKGATVRQLRVPENKIEGFFRDTQYQEFIGYKEIEVTTKGKNDFPDLSIPRPKSYQIWVDGEAKNVFLQLADDDYLVHKSDSDDFRYDSLKITLRELQLAENYTMTKGGTSAVLDEARERIVCKLKPIQKMYQKEVRYDLNSDDEAVAFAKKNMGKVLKIEVDGAPWVEQRIKSSEARRAVNNDGITITPSEVGGFKFSIKSATIRDNKLVVVVGAYKKSKKGGGTTKTDADSSSGFSAKWLIIGLLAGLLIGGAVMWLLMRQPSDDKTISTGVTPANTGGTVVVASGEKECYEKVLAAPFDKDKPIGKKEYYEALMKNDTTVYTSYLVQYSNDTAPDAREHFDEVSRRWGVFCADRDSIKLMMERLDKKVEGNLYLKIKAVNENWTNNNKVKENCEECIRLCDDYKKLYENYLKLCDEALIPNDIKTCLKDVNGWQNNANGKLTELGKDSEKEKVRAEGLKQLNAGNLNWVRQSNNKQYFSTKEKTAYEWILDYRKKLTDDLKIKKIDNLLKSKNFPSKGFDSWAKACELYEEIEKIVNSNE